MPSNLLEEIKQRKPFPSAYAEAAVSLLRTADLLRRHMNATIERNDITLQQYNVLRILRGANGWIPTLEIANRMIEQTPGITRLLDRLEERKLVIRKRCTEDRRQVLCSISPTGLELLAALDVPVKAADENALGRLTPDQITQLLAFLDTVRESLQEKLAD